MAPKPVLAELLRFIAANEDLPRTLARYKGYDRDTLGKLLNAAADRVDEAEKAREPAAGAGSKGVKVRRQSEVEKLAARTAEELEEGMSLSKVERDARRRDRAADEEKARALEGRRAEAVKVVDPSLLAKYENIKRRRAGVAIAQVVGMTCKGCHRNIPPQLAIVLARANSIETCPSCHRIIYSAEAVNPPAPSPA